MLLMKFKVFEGWNQCQDTIWEKYFDSKSS